MGFLARFLFLLLLFTRIRALLDPLGRAIQLKKSELLTGGGIYQHDQPRSS